MFYLSTFYQSKQWIKLVTMLRLEREDNKGTLYCEHCGMPIVHKYDCIGHHMVELTEENVNDITVSLNPELIKLVHHRCHNVIHERFGNEGTSRVYLVYGSPFSGKSTWVKENAGHDDLILDIDKVWQCISINGPYIKPARLKENVFQIRDSILDMIRIRQGKWRNAYVIGGYPLAGERERLINRLGAIEIFIDTPYDECIERLAMCDDGRNADEWKKFIDEWWNKFCRVPPVRNKIFCRGTVKGSLLSQKCEK